MPKRKLSAVKRAAMERFKASDERTLVEHNKGFGIVGKGATKQRSKAVVREMRNSQYAGGASIFSSQIPYYGGRRPGNSHAGWTRSASYVRKSVN